MKHGTKWMYIKYKCRCQPCTDANTTSHRKYMRKKYNRRPYENTIPRNIRIANINRLKENTSCVDCGGLFPAVCMDFDHRDPSLKRFSISQGFSNSPLTLMCEIAKCDIVCANCHRIRTKKQRDGPPLREYKEQTKLFEGFRGIPCMDCNTTYPVECMDFDHRDPSTKSFTIGRNKWKQVDILLEEITKCDIVCSNCHRIRTHLVVGVHGRLIQEGRTRNIRRLPDTIRGE